MKKQAGRPEIEPELYTDITLSWILKCYDSGRTGVVKVHSLMIGLVALCHATIQEKYAFVFDLMSSDQNQISFSNLKIIIQDLLQLPHNVGETKVFSVDAAADTAKSCWNYNGKQTLEYVTRDEFWMWVKREPVSLVWFPTLYRIATSETVKHEATCSVCKTFPIVGIRYRCLKCSNVDICQVCFWRQSNTVKDHKITHPTREYCLATTTGDDVKDFAKQLKNKLTRKYRRRPPKKTYLDYTIQGGGDDGPDRDTGESLVFNNVHTRISNMAQRLLALEEESEPDEEGTDSATAHQQRGVAGENTEARLRAEELAIIEARGRQEAEELASVEARGRQEAELASQEIERQMAGLQGRNQELMAEVERLTHLLLKKPKEVKVPFAIPPPPPKIPLQASPFVDTKSQAVNTLLLGEMTSSSGTHSPREWSTTLLGEQQELDSILADLLTAFPPPHSTGVFPTDLGNELFLAAKVVGNTLGALVEKMTATQDF
ncbi:Dystrophin, isoform D [Geodia barretti]|nr:Dystrophin, isoform D [Geodia barretti]